MRIHLLLPVVLIASACEKKQSSIPLAERVPSSADLRKGEYFESIGKTDSAFIYYNEVTKNFKDSLLAGMAYSYMSNIQQETGDFYGVQESAVAGLKVLNEDSLSHWNSLASLYNNLGRSKVSTKNYDSAISYYKRAIELQPYAEYRNVYRNNLAVALREKGAYKEALDSFLSIKPRQDEDRKDFARRTTNIASLKWKAAPNFNPLPDLHYALNVRVQEKHGVGMTASYNHLLDYYLLKNPDSALFYAKKMYTSAQKTNSADDQLEALRKLISIAPPLESRELFNHYQQLNDSVQNAQIAANSQFAIIRYDSEKSKAQNLLLQEDNAQKELQILRQQITVVGSILIAGLIIGGVSWRYRKKKQQMKLETQATIQENQLRISQKVHDTVANGLYRIMSEIEHVENLDKEPLLDRIEALYERSRDISYEPLEAENNTAEKINRLLTSFATPTTKISVVGNQEELWIGVPSVIVKELEKILQELMVNMKKHSDAQHVVLHFSKSDGHLEIGYKDDGQGFPSNFRKGNGLKSTGTRINQIGGQINFAVETARGAAIKILVPILSNDQKSINS